MSLTWSHAVLYVKNLENMLDFYTNVLGFDVTDRGTIRPGGPDIVFLSQDPNEHHQLAMLPTRGSDGPSNSVHHFAFRVGSFVEVKDLTDTLQQIDGMNIGPLSHGNTLSIYFNDPEGNGIEVFWDTPWHVAQPQGKPWDTTLGKADALEWVKREFGEEPTFEPREAFYQRRHDAV